MNATDVKTPIVIVEDDPTWGEVLTKLFDKKYSTHLFTSGEECMANIVQIQPKFMILDYHLEGMMSGWDTLKEINKLKSAKKLDKDLPIIMFTAQTDVEVAARVMADGAFDYVRKGEDAVDRFRIILRNIHRAQEERERYVAEINLKIKRNNMYFAAIGALIFIISSVVYLYTCPDARLISWDPFNRAATSSCTKIGGDK
ncbi:MAG: response regulator [Bacteroidia bacterium]|nr:response regulator [Bacteroidia bacterium]MDW8332979.1 response regulator [Bacteroidia bacterium]